MKLCSLLLISSLMASAFAEEESPKDNSAADSNAKPSQEKKSAPQKTLYDKLGLGVLIKKAEGKDREAQFELASRFNYGRGMPKNTAEGVKWLKRAAENEHLEAMRLLTLKFYEGHDVVPDYQEALKWASKLSEFGDIPAQLTLANMYANGDGTARDLVQAYKWYAIAASGDAEAHSEDTTLPDKIKLAADARDKLSGLISEAEEVEAQSQASEWWIRKDASKKPPKKTKKVED